VLARLSSTAHSHPGSIFAYLLDGSTENQVDLGKAMWRRVKRIPCSDSLARLRHHRAEKLARHVVLQQARPIAAKGRVVARRRMTRAIYMAVVSGVRSNPVIKNFYAQLRARGKYPKSALTACMRKLLVILNAMLHNKTHWLATARTSPTSALYPLGGAISEHGCC
jgi:hypothetical protein